MPDKTNHVPASDAEGELRRQIGELVHGPYHAIHGWDTPLVNKLLGIFHSHAAKEVEHAIQVYAIEQSIERLDVQCSEGKCKNCDSKRPRLEALRQELAQLQEESKP